MSGRHIVLWAVGIAVVGATAAGCAAVRHNRDISAPPSASASRSMMAGRKVLATFRPTQSSGLITNEYAYFNPKAADRRTSSDWQMTSGSLFAQAGMLWTGKPDSCDGGPNAESTNCTNSNVFRLNTARIFAGDTAVNLVIKQNAEVHNPRCSSDDTCWHGAHIWLRYQNEYNLYYVSVNRADDQVVIKRKVPCGDDNDGTYAVLGSYRKHGFRTGTWNDYFTTVHDNTDGSVSLALYDGASGQRLTAATDRGGVNPKWSPQCVVPGKYPTAAYPPLTGAGSVGVRGDYANMVFNMTVYGQ